MRYLAIGDIHGCYTALTRLVEAVGLRDDDVLITLGDYVDRGPDSKRVIDWLIDRHEKGSLIALRGNHDVMMIQSRTDARTLNDWLLFGGQATLRSYTGADRTPRIDDVPDAHWRFLEQICRPYYETDTHIFVHGGVLPDAPLAEQPEYMLYWEKFNDPPPHVSGKVVVCGHTAQKSGAPRDIGHAVCIDTWVYGDGWLTCLDTATGWYWQANQRGQTRDGWLNPIATFSD